MRQIWLVVDWQRGTIALVVFGRVGLGVGKIWNFELVGVEENHRWSCDGVDISFRDLVHHLNFSDLPRKVWRASQSRG